MTRPDQTPRCGCGQPAPDATICRRCTARLARHLAEVPALAAAAAGTYAGQAHLTRPDSGRRLPDPDAALPQTAKIQRLPWDEAVSVAIRELRTVLVAEARALLEDQPPPPAGPSCRACGHQSCARLRAATRAAAPPADTVPSIAVWLLQRLPDLRRAPDAAETLDAVARAVARLRRTVDNAPDQLYAGPCTNALVPVQVDGVVTIRECGTWSTTERRVTATDLYAPLEASAVTCRVCGMEYDVESRRSWMLTAARDHLAPAPLIAQALTAMGREVTPRRISRWVERGLLLARGRDGSGRPLYRVGEVEDRQIADALRVAARGSRTGGRVSV